MWNLDGFRYFLQRTHRKMRRIREETRRMQKRCRVAVGIKIAAMEKEKEREREVSNDAKELYRKEKR